MEVTSSIVNADLHLRGSTIESEFSPRDISTVRERLTGLPWTIDSNYLAVYLMPGYYYTFNTHRLNGECGAFSGARVQCQVSVSD